MNTFIDGLGAAGRLEENTSMVRGIRVHTWRGRPEEYMTIAERSALLKIMDADSSMLESPGVPASDVRYALMSLAYRSRSDDRVWGRFTFYDRNGELIRHCIRAARPAGLQGHLGDGP